MRINEVIDISNELHTFEVIINNELVPKIKKQYVDHVTLSDEFKKSASIYYERHDIIDIIKELQYVISVLTIANPAPTQAITMANELMEWFLQSY